MSWWLYAAWENNLWSNLSTGRNSRQINKVNDMQPMMEIFECLFQIQFAARKLEIQVLLFTNDDTEDDAYDRFLCFVILGLALTLRFGEDSNGFFFLS